MITYVSVQAVQCDACQRVVPVSSLNPREGAEAHLPPCPESHTHGIAATSGWSVQWTKGGPAERYIPQFEDYCPECVELAKHPRFEKISEDVLAKLAKMKKGLPQ